MSTKLEKTEKPKKSKRPNTKEIVKRKKHNKSTNNDFGPSASPGTHTQEREDSKKGCDEKSDLNIELIHDKHTSFVVDEKTYKIAKQRAYNIVQMIGGSATDENIEAMVKMTPIAQVEELASLMINKPGCLPSTSDTMQISLESTDTHIVKRRWEESLCMSHRLPKEHASMQATTRALLARFVATV